ncbi:MAG: hypothetical protein ACREOF_04040 [Gemmatimonadales bacterium]
MIGGAGVALERPILVWAAIVLLGLSLLLRLVAAFRDRRAASASDSLSAPEDG